MKRMRVNFSNKELKIHGSSMHRAIGDYDEATGILWNVKPDKGVDPNDPRSLGVGVHMASGNLIQLMPEGTVSTFAGGSTPPLPALPEVSDEEVAAAALAPDPEAEAALASPPAAPWTAPAVKDVPVTEAAKRAAAKLAAAKAPGK